MGHISLPNLDDIVQIKDPQKQMEALLNTVGILIKNLSELNGYLTSKNIRANSIVADRMDVNELSAISANLGTIEAGEVYGAYIATSHDYPKVEMSSGDDLIQASRDADRFIYVTPFSGTAPAIQLFDGINSKSLLFYVNPIINGSVVAAIGNLHISATGGNIRFEDWDQIYSNGDGQTLQAALDDLSSRITALGG